jgi:L-seryl-tRNA(Ser) seleniumtransferase
VLLLREDIQMKSKSRGAIKDVAQAEDPNRRNLLRFLPSMNAVLEAFDDPTATGCNDPCVANLCRQLSIQLPRLLLRESIESFLDRYRVAILAGDPLQQEELTVKRLLPKMTEYVARVSKPHFRRVCNATGVIIHTNLGRSLLAEEALAAVTESSRYYSNLEFNLETGRRGSRYSHVESLIRRLTGAESGLVVNNNAAAVFLVLDTLCKGREVVISRGELVEIGGSFRIPEVMEKSGCILREVGTTNRTHMEDYAAAIAEQTAALMKVHTSNYRIIGFTKEVCRKDLAALAREKGLPLLEDLGSGIPFDLGDTGHGFFKDEPTAAQVLGEGVDVVTFSGDKVLGGPQAGIIAGKAEYIDRIKKNSLTRALRVDKMTLAALEATFRLYIDPELAKARIPTLRMLYMREDELLQRSRELADGLRSALASSPGGGSATVTVQKGNSRVGGGAFPERNLPTHLVCLALAAFSPEQIHGALLRTSPPTVARVEHDMLCLDPRTMHAEEDALVCHVISQAIAALQTEGAGNRVPAGDGVHREK